MFSKPHRERVRFAVRQRVEGYCWIKYPSGGEDILDCVVDTGADRTTIPQAFWEPLVPAAFVSRLPRKTVKGVGGNLEVAELNCSVQVSGASDFSDNPFDLGMCGIWLAFDGLASNQDKNRKPMVQVLLGLRGGALDKGGLCINWKEQKAYFVEVD